MMDHYTHDNWQTWFEHLSAPFSESECGEDLKYEEDFKYLKSSFSGVNELDCKRVFKIGTELVAEKSKDLRIAGYLLVSAAGEFSIEGLANGFLLFNELSHKYTDVVHPTKNKARIGVLNWMLGQQARIVALAEQQALYEPKAIELLNEQLTRYGNETVRLFDENAGPLSDLSAWVSKLLKQYPVKEAIEEKPESEKEKNNASLNTPSNPPAKEKRATAPAVPVAPMVLSSGSIDSDSQFNDALRKLLAFDKEQQNYARMIALSRAARWSDIKLPPNEGGKTRIPAPRATAFAPIKNALANENYAEALIVCESLFMEGAMHFNLDLQMMLLSALKGLGKSAIISQVELSIYQLISRFPTLVNLTYDDGSALCSAKSKDVITEISAQFNQSGVTGTDTADKYNEAEQAAKKLVEEGKLDKALSLLSELSSSTSFDSAQVQLIKAKVCLQAERYDFASPMLQRLVEQIERHMLDHWQPEFSMQVWKNAVLCFEMLASQGNENFDNKCSLLKEKMILTRPEMAVSWI